MNFDNISSAMMIVFDELRNDPESEIIIDNMDTADGDDNLKSGFKDAIRRLRELGKEAIAEDIEKKIKGW